LEFSKDIFEFELGIVSVKSTQSEFCVFGGEHLISNVLHSTGTKESVIPIDNTNWLGGKLRGTPKVIVD
jgi:hypothetical protein